MTILSENLVNNLRREDWLVNSTRKENPDGSFTYQASADRGDAHLCAEGRTLTEALARLYQLCNQNGQPREREGELSL